MNGPDIIEGAWNRSLTGKIREQRDEIDRLRAELAYWQEINEGILTVADILRQRWKEAEARIAAVIALCAETHGADARLYVAHVRAAATGDGTFADPR